MKGRIDNTIHIRPSLGSIQEAQYELSRIPLELHSHIVMMTMHKFLIVSHDKDHQCFICQRTEQCGVKEKYVY